MDAYSIMEFKKDDIRKLDIFPKTHDLMFEFGNILELAALDAFWYGLGENSSSNSYHGKRLLTVLYKPQKISLFEVQKPFSAHYIGSEEEMKLLREGFQSFFGKDAKYSQTDNIDKGKAAEFVENLNSNDEEGRYHTCLALNHIGIGYEEADAFVNQMVRKELIENLRTRDWFRKIEQSRHPSHF
jgi:hypothetical protein